MALALPCLHLDEATGVMCVAPVLADTKRCPQHQIVPEPEPKTPPLEPILPDRA